MTPRLFFLVAFTASLVGSTESLVAKPSFASRWWHALDDDSKKDESQEADKKEDPEKKAREHAKKTDQLEHATKIAKLELQLAKIDSDMQVTRSENAVKTAQDELDEAQMALRNFLEHEAPVELEGAKISLDQARHRADHAKDELEELIAMYEAEEFAEMTKELVVKRGRRNLEIAERNLELSQRKLDHLQNTVHPHKQRKLQRTVQGKESALVAAELGVEKTKLEVEIRMSKAEFGLAVAERDLKQHQAEGPKS